MGKDSQKSVLSTLFKFARVRVAIQPNMSQRLGRRLLPTASALASAPVSPQQPLLRQPSMTETAAESLMALAPLPAIRKNTQVTELARHRAFGQRQW